MVQVIKVMNNSLILALNDEGKEVILMGKGIGYKKSIGEDVDDSQVEKVFELTDNKMKRDFLKLAVDTNSIYFELASQIIKYAIDTYQMEIVDYLYLSLTDHIAYCVQRILENVSISNYYLREMKKLNPNEFDVGEYGVKLISKTIGIQIPKDEIGNIAFHFIHGQSNREKSMANLEIEKITKNVLHIVKLHFNLTYDEDSFAYSRFCSHVQLLAQRIVSAQMVEDKEDFLVESIKSNCKKEFECVQKIVHYLQTSSNITLTEQEQMYLTIHVHRILEK